MTGYASVDVNNDKIYVLTSTQILNQIFSPNDEILCQTFVGGMSHISHIKTQKSSKELNWVSGKNSFQIWDGNNEDVDERYLIGR